MNKEIIEAMREQIIDFCRTIMAVYREPRNVVFVDQLPKSATGKKLKHILKGDK